MRVPVALVILAACVVACTGGAPAAPPATAALPSPAATTPDGRTPLHAGALAPGAYTTTAFEPQLTFTLGDGWSAAFQDDSDEVALEHASGAFLNMTRVTKVIDPATLSTVAAPDDLVGWLSTHPALAAQPPEPVTVGGLAGSTLVVHPAAAVTTFAYPTGNMRVPAGVTVRYYVLPMDGPDLTLVIGAPTSDFDRAIALAEPVIASLEVATGG